MNELDTASHSERYYFGIDLGTTNSVISVYDAATNSNYAIRVRGSTLLRSQVWKNGDTIKVGDVHKSGEVERIRDVKSNIATSKIFRSGDLSLTSIEASAMILKELVDCASEEFEDVDNIVITVPAKFNHIQRASTLKAASLAGIKVKCLINEPTAAALAYMDKVDTQSNILVYDFGGGTFDVSIVNIMPRMEKFVAKKYDIKLTEIDRQVATVIASDGDVNLGGNDIDMFMVSRALSDANINDCSDADRAIVKDLAQEIKEDENKDIMSYKLSSGAVVTMRREYCEDATRHMYNKTLKIVKDLLRKHSSIPIDRIVLVGGSTKNKQIKRLLENDFKGIKSYSNINPDECVAIGASKNSYILSGDSNTSFYDVVSGTYSMTAMDYEGSTIVVPMIAQGSPIPSFKISEITKSSDSQEYITIDIYQGESLKFERNLKIGTLLIDNLPKDMPEGEKIRCRFRINSSGMLAVSAMYRDVQLSTLIDTSNIVLEEETDLVLNALTELTNIF